MGNKTHARRRAHDRARVGAALRRCRQPSREFACGHANPLRCTLPSAPPVQAEAKRLWARVATLAPGGACVMSSEGTEKRVGRRGEEMGAACCTPTKSTVSLSRWIWWRAQTGVREAVQGRGRL